MEISTVRRRLKSNSGSGVDEDEKLVKAFAKAELDAAKQKWPK